MPLADEAVRRSARVLTGFMSPEEANAFASFLVLDGQGFLNAWQQQRAALPQPLPPSLPALRIEQLPPAATAHVTAVQAAQLFAPIYGVGGFEFKMVELGKLIACQTWVDTHVSGGVLGAGMQAAPTFDEILNTCLPLSVIPPTRTFTQRLPNGLIAYSMNNTLTVQGPGFDQNTGQITFALGAGANLLLVREHAGRYVLANGYHRAWLLRSRGVTMVPAIITPVASQQQVVPGEGFFKPDLLFGPRPPIVDDMLDSTFSIDVEVRAVLKAVKVTAELLFVPRLL